VKNLKTKTIEILNSECIRLVNLVEIEFEAGTVCMTDSCNDVTFGQNLLQYSENFSKWNKFNVNVNTSLIESPDETSNTYAFKIVENGYTTNDGALILGKKPKWNIFSNNSAGEWKLPSNSDGTIYFRLKRSPYDSNRYAFSLGSFRGYNHLAIQPSIGIDNLTNEYDFPRRFDTIDVDFLFHCLLGEYNWTTLAANASDIKIMIYNPSNNLILETPNVPIYPFYANGDTTFHYDFSVKLLISKPTVCFVWQGFRLFYSTNL